MLRSWIIGGRSDCDLVVDRPSVSGRHCRLERVADGFLLEDLGSTNGTFVNGHRIDVRTRVTRADTITLGQLIPMPWPSEPDEPGSRTLRIGRAPGNDVVIDLPMIADQHARITWEGKSGAVTLEDLGSPQGTALGAPDRRITRSAVTAADTIYLGTHPLPAAPLLARLDRSLVPSLSLSADQAIIGRDGSCDRIIDLPVVSGRHARLFWSEGRAWIEDLGSSNGTHVNGQRIGPAAAIVPGDLISLGSATFVFAAPEPPRATDVQAALTRPPTGRGPLGEGFERLRGRPGVLAALLAQAPLLAVALVLIGRAGGSGPSASLLFHLGLAALWLGLSTGIASGGTRGLAGLLARLAVLGTIAAIECLAAWAIVRLGAGLGGPPPAELALLLLTTAVGLAAGRALVALVPRPASALAALPVIVLACWLLGGERWKLNAMPAGARAVASLLPARWSFEGLLLIESARDDLADAYFPAETDRMGPRAAALALGLMSVGLLAAAFVAASRENSNTDGKD